MLIRPIESDDIPAIVELIADFRVSLAKLSGKKSKPDLQSAKVEFNSYQTKKFPIFVADNQNGKIVGYIVCRVDENVVWAESLHVLAKYRRTGIGSLLYQEAEKLAFEKGNTTLYNWIHPTNNRIIEFLKKQGYTALNLIEIKRPEKKQDVAKTISVGNQTFHYG